MVQKTLNKIFTLGHFNFGRCQNSGKKLRFSSNFTYNLFDLFRIASEKVFDHFVLHPPQRVFLLRSCEMQRLLILMETLEELQFFVGEFLEA